jgi:hypothetical protein
MSTSLEASRSCLDQAIDLLDRLSNEQYAGERGDWSPVGAQYRHVVEHFQSVIAGAAAGRIDYDARPRNRAIEQSRLHALHVTDEIRQSLSGLESLSLDHPIAVQIRSLPDAALPEWSHSTLGRELQFLVSHTVHHFALIKLLLIGDQLDLPPDFGTAPSTLAHARRA